MLGILLVIDLLALALTAFLVRWKRESLRESVLIGFILWGTAVLFSTEILSLFHALGFWEILVFWILVLGGCVAFAGKYWKPELVKRVFYPGRGPITASDVKSWPFLEKVFFNRIVFFSFCLGVIALAAPPSNYDAMIYHMARVMHWIQNRTVMYYPTNITRQLVYPSFSEYVILHFQLLSQGDYWANFVQWLAMCGSLVGVSLIARELGCSRRGQLIAALIALTIPMGILQATSAQTDYVDTLWLCCLVYFFFCWRRTGGWGYIYLIGASLGLDIVTKGVVLIYAMPFLGWMLIEIVRRKKTKEFYKIGGIVLGIALLFYAGILYRNALYFHGQTAKFVAVDTDSLINNRFCWEGFGANLLRNTGLHVITPSLSVNKSIKEGIYHLASYAHIDLNNKDWSFCGAQFETIDFRGFEDYLGNPWHLLLFGVVFILFVSSPKFRSRDAVYYLAACFLGWILFNAILKWQPYHSRFHLGLFVIFCPLAGFVIEKIRLKWIVSGAMGALFLSAWIIILIDVTKPIINPLSIFYPQNRAFLHYIAAESPKETFLEYETIANMFKKIGCKNIGLIMGPGENEYLLWVALNPSSDPSMRMESILVNKASASLPYPLGDFTPDAILAINDQRPLINWGNNLYLPVWHNQGAGKAVSIYLKSN